MKIFIAAITAVFLLPICAFPQINQGSGAGSVQNPNANGGGTPPASPANSIQTANSTATGLASDPNFTIDPTSHTLSAGANMRVNAMSSVPRNSYDPMDTKFMGGLSAAIAGTSGFTPTQVLQNTITYAWCQGALGLAPITGVSIPLPAGVTINISSLKLINGMSFGGEHLTNRPTLQHTDATKPMLLGTIAGDTFTCPQDGQVHNVGASGGIFIHDIGISGMGATAAGTLDVGIDLNGPADMVYDIAGSGQGFGGPAIFFDGSFGLQKFGYFLGYPGSQLNGCLSYTNGALPIATQSPFGLGHCETVMDGATDTEMAFVYATDSAQQIGGSGVNGPGACYPNCAAVSGGNNASMTDIFTQISDVDIALYGASNKVSNVRLDGTSMEGMRIMGTGAHVINNVLVLGPCTSTSLQAAFGLGTNTGCYAINDQSQGSIITNVQAGTSLFGTSFMECMIANSHVGFNGASSIYGLLGYQGFPDNTTRNGMAYCGAFQGDQVSARAVFPNMAPMDAHNALVNASGITSVNLATTTPVTHITGGIAGQDLYITGVSGSSIVPGSVGLESIGTCTGLPEVNDGSHIYHFKNKGGFQASGFGANNAWKEVCNSPNITPLHVNFGGNPTVAQPAMVDFFGNLMARQQPSVVLSVSQLHGAAAPSGQYCFVEKVTYADGSYAVSQQACTTVDLTHQTAGEIFGASSPQAVAYDIYLQSNTTTSGLPLGKYPNTGGPAGLFWDGPTTIAAGGDGSTPPVPGDNYTGIGKFPNGWQLLTTSTLPTCNAARQGIGWLINNGGSSDDQFQMCIQKSGGTYAWSSLGGGSSLPAASNGQIVVNTGGGTTYAAQAQILYAQSGDTISSIETACSSLCTYIVATPQTFTLAANHTLSSNVQLDFRAGGQWTVNGAFTLTIPGNVTGTLNRHFAGTSTIAFGLQQQYANVEWFGAVGDWNGTTGTDNAPAFQKTVNALSSGQAVLQGLAYFINGTLTINKNAVGVKGSSQQTTFIVSTSATADMIDVAGANAGSPVIANQIEDLVLFRTVAGTGTSAGLSMNYTSAAIVNRVQSVNSVRDFYLHSTGSNGSGDIRNCTAQNTAGTGTYYGFYADSSDGVGNLSLRMHNNFYFNSTSGTTYGYYATGSSIKDLMSWNFETANASYGQYFNYTAGADAFGASDIHLYGPINDSYKISSIVANGLVISGNPGLSIVGGESSSVVASGGKGIDLESSTQNVSIVGHQMWGNAAYQIYLGTGVANNSITGNTIMGFTGAHGIFVQGPSNTNIISGNNLYGTAATDDIALAGAVTDSVIANNTIVGTTTNAISLSATSIRTHGLETNSINVVGTAINNAGFNPLDVSQTIWSPATALTGACGSVVSGNISIGNDGTMTWCNGTAYSNLFKFNIKGVVAGSETVTFSATPTFSVGFRASIITLTGNITTFTLGAGSDGQEKTLTFCQNATGGFTVAGPANVRGLMTVGVTASQCSSQHFTYSVGQTAWLADSPGVINE